MYKVAIPIQVRFSDIDMYQHVNNTVYPAYIELARLEYFRDHINADLRKESAFTVSFEINYKRSASFQDKLEVLIKTEEIGNSSLTMEYAVVSKADNSVIFAHGRVKQVHVDPKTGQVVSVSNIVRDKVMDLEDLPRDLAYPVSLN